MPLDVVNIVASQAILRSSTPPPSPATTARVSIAAGLFPGVLGLVLPIVVARSNRLGTANSGEGVAVPNVADGHTTLDAATKELAASSLTAHSSRAFSTDYPAGIVISQQPQAGTIRPLNTPVRVVVSDGPPPPPNGDGSSSNDVATAADVDAARRDIEQQVSTQLGNTRQDIEAMIGRRVKTASDDLSLQIASLGGRIDEALGKTAMKK